MSVSICTLFSLQNYPYPWFGEDSQDVAWCSMSLSLFSSCGGQNHRVWRQIWQLWSQQWPGWRRSVHSWRREHPWRQLWYGRRDHHWWLLLWEWEDVQHCRWQLHGRRGLLLCEEMCHHHNGQILRGQILSPHLHPPRESSTFLFLPPAAQPLSSPSVFRRKQTVSEGNLPKVRLKMRHIPLAQAGPR